MAGYRRLWWTLICVLMLTFSLLGFFGREVYRQAPPIPGKVVTTDGRLLMTRDTILDGQTAWQSVGGMELGSIWGHGAYQAPDWSADWLHRELLAWLNLAAQDQFGKPYGKLSDHDQQVLQIDLKDAYRHNTYNKRTDTRRPSPKPLRTMTNCSAPIRLCT